MESAKEKAIREAYYEEFRISGTPEHDLEPRFKAILFSLDFETGWFEGKLHRISVERLDLSGYECRPKSLQGVDNNNGWTRIESEADLPVTNSECWAVWKLNGFITTDTFKQSDDKEYAAEQIKYWMEKYSHHQPKIKPKPPIY